MNTVDQTVWYTVAKSNIEVGFKLAMRRLAATITIVSTGGEDGYHGLAATAVTSLSTEPPAILVCINRDASPSEPLIRSGKFAINILHSDNAPLVGIFSGKIKGAARFKHGEWGQVNNVPVLMNAQAAIVCSVANCNVFGTHTIIIGLVEAIRIRDDIDPVVYQDGYLGRVVSLN